MIRQYVLTPQLSYVCGPGRPCKLVKTFQSQPNANPNTNVDCYLFDNLALAFAKPPDGWDCDLDKDAPCPPQCAGDDGQLRRAGQIYRNDVNVPLDFNVGTCTTEPMIQHCVSQWNNEHGVRFTPHPQCINNGMFDTFSCPFPQDA